MSRFQTFKHRGVCPICEKTTVFKAKESWFRDHLLCPRCHSIPRERALMMAIREFFPNFRQLEIHESSPSGRGVSTKLLKECAGYSFSHYFPDVEPGNLDPSMNARCENLEKLTFEDASHDLFITQDVMEHVFDPVAAFREIARVLRPGGAHIFSVPLVNKSRPSCRRATLLESGEIQYLLEPQYHGNPIDPDGSLVTMDWGYDIAVAVQEACGMPTLIFQKDEIDLGIRAEYLEILVSLKSHG